jgi:DNA-binding transcriptional regulator GbsR (MarR family)
MARRAKVRHRGVRRVQYIQDVLNIQNSGGDSQHQFADLMSRLLAAWELPPAAGRVYGYLLLSEGPVSLDQLAAELQMSKSGASVASRLLETWGLAQRTHERGSKRLLYQATSDIEVLVAARMRATQAFVDVFRRGAAIAPSSIARRRMEEMAEFFEKVMTDGDRLIREWLDEKRRRNR